MSLSRPATLVSPLRGTGRIVDPNSATLILTVSALAVVTNVLGGTLVGLLAIPFLFLDTIGTFVVAATFGIRWGILVGVVSNLVLGITDSPSTIPFALVQVVIAVIVGSISNKWGFTLRSAAISGVIVAVIAPIVGTAIAVGVFGGLTGGAVDVVVLWFEQAGQSAFSSAFWPRLGSNLIDKILTGFIAYAVLRAIPTALIRPRYREEVVAADPIKTEEPAPVV